MVVSVAVGTALTASLLTLSFEIKGRVAQELRAFGANIVVEPRAEGLAALSGQKRYLRQSDVVRAKTIFWRHNIVGVAPFLYAGAVLGTKGLQKPVTVAGAWYEQAVQVPGERAPFLAGIRAVFPSWALEGTWAGRDEVVVGRSLARERGTGVGESLSIDGRDFRISGILETGGQEEGRIFMDLDTLQNLKGLQGRVSQAFVSALTTPMDDFAYKDPGTMTKAEYDKWYCTGYVTSIAKQLEEVFDGSRAKPVWQVAETEGKVLDSLRVLIYLMCAAVLGTAVLGISTTMVMGLLRRQDEIGLMKALGADRLQVVMLFLAEGLVIGLAGGGLGYLLSLGIADFLGRAVFETGLRQPAMLVLVSLGSAVVISVAGTLLSIRRALRIQPAVVLKDAL